MKLKGPRVRVRRSLGREDEIIRTLIDEVALGAVDCRWERHVIERRSDGAALGVVEHRIGDAHDSFATFGSIVMADGERGWGYGSEAVHLIEKQLRQRHGVRQMRALIDRRIGLAFYFWLRQGYRPPEQGEALCPTGEGGDIISVIRTL